MNNDKMREEFEAWFESNKHFVLGTRKISKGDCFFIWQASRAAIELQMPPYASSHGGVTFDAFEVLQVIGDAGLKARI